MLSTYSVHLLVRNVPDKTEGASAGENGNVPRRGQDGRKCEKKDAGDRT